MASSAGRDGAQIKHPRVLLPFTCDSLRIPDELAEGIGAEEALVVGPASGTAKHWRVEVGWDGDGAFLGRGWPEFADACGVEAGWLLVLRHRGHGLLTVKAFDANCCLIREQLRTPAPRAVGATASSKGASRKPQFIRVHSRDFMEKLLIPSEFVQQHLPNEKLNNRQAIIFGPLGEVSHIELEKNSSDDVFFSGACWLKFRLFYNITEADALQLTYEGNMVFTVKVFDHDGYQRESNHKETRAQLATSSDIGEQERQEAPSVSIQKHCKIKVPGSDGEKKPKGIATPLNEEPSWMKPVYEIGRPSSVKKQINANTLKELGPSTIITLKTSMSSTESWKVHAVQRKDMAGYRLLQGWRLFCSDNNIKLGDICTFTVIETTLWHVIACTRCKETINHLCNYLPPVFCKAIGISKPCTVTLKTSMSSTRTWQARVAPYQGTSHHVSGQGWTQFCRENRIKVGDVCTINFVETTMWHVIINSRE
ncbi:putative B3 domain-containing protein Os04g0346900 [Panicum virgatum]|uniref:putative B3 domain-containing protein Os04g0346900 n=1 Tax=Panicum virgatum TaxID=38727 RepID=UPI0019D586A6|nr:putative B3 domain-containing protein Os04g0346900 [Panicum virgatum]